MSRRLIDLTGHVFGRLLVIDRNGVNNENQPKWLCICDCGNEKTVNGRDLREGATTSCGCFQLENIKIRSITHGMTNSSEYKSWSCMKDRCKENSKKREYYFDKNISVCERWVNSFENFINDMGIKPTNLHTIERIDNNKGYYPENCKWATRKEQCITRNTRNRYTANKN